MEQIIYFQNTGLGTDFQNTGLYRPLLNKQ